MIPITDTLAIREEELEFTFVRASGPGGQHVNKASTAAQLRFDVAHSPSLPEPVRERLLRLAGRQLTAEGVLIIEAQRHRSQERNRKDALNRLVLLIRQAAQKPKIRHKTRMPGAAKERRLRGKQRRSEAKQRRRSLGEY